MNCPACGASNETAGEHCFSCGKTLFALTEGTLVGGRYELRQMLGRGGMGIVYRAFDRALEEEVALKILRPDVASAADLTRRFRSEIKLARRVRHRNVCGIHEYGQDGPIHYIAMELIAGEDLKRQLLAHGPLPPAEAWDVAVQIAEGLDAIHHADVVHRDLKAHNIMRDTRGVVRVMDFGIAKALGMAASGATVTGQIIGTPEYMSPEQARGDQIDFRSDIYALGIVIFELFTGNVPFRGETPIATLFKHIQDPPPLDGQRGIPPRLVPILKKALAKDPGGRYESAHAMAAALREGLEEETARASHPTMVFDVPTVVESGGQTSVSPPTMVTPRRVPERPAAPRKPVPPPPRPTSGRTVPLAVAALAIAAAMAGAAFFIRSRPLPSPDGPSPAPPVSAAGSVTVAPPSPIREVSPSAPPDTLPAVVMTLPAPTTTLPATATPRPQRPSPAPTARPAPVAATTPAPTAAAEGTVRVRVLPWAEVEVDGEPRGTTPLRPLTLRAGEHVLRFRHPDFRPLIRRITVRANETTTVEVDLARDAFPR